MITSVIVDRTAIRELDQLIQQVAPLESEALTSDWPRIESTLLSEVCRATGANVTDDSPSLADVATGPEFVNARPLLAAMLVRLLHANAAVGQCADRLALFRLIDEVLGPVIYGALGITGGDQTYLKESRLIESIDRLAAELAVGPAPHDLGNLDSFRQRLMKAIKGKLATGLAQPFLGMSTLLPALQDAFTLTAQYVSARPAEKAVAYQRALEALSRLEHPDGSVCGEVYEQAVCLPIGSLRTSLAHDFERSPLSKPATVIVVSAEKKHPLHQAGLDLSLTMNVENSGPGWALDVELEVQEASSLEIGEPSVFVGTLEPSSVRVDVPVQVTEAMESALMLVEVRWKNFDGSGSSAAQLLEFPAQRTDLDWETLAVEEPYDLEPIAAREALVGRSTIIEALLARTQTRSMGSAYVYGQKRVGKTSIVRTLQTIVEDGNSGVRVLTVFLESGDYVHPAAAATVEALGRSICEELAALDEDIARIPLPVFEGALSPLSAFLRDAQRAVPGTRFLIILDEFDNLPRELYTRGAVGDAFFSTIRSISGKSAFAFVLVGGERMPLVLADQGDEFNKFKAIPVGYLDKRTQLSDFRRLVTEPVQDWLEYSGEALDTIYDESAGNPYFAKLICGEVAATAVRARDCHITYAEINAACATLAMELEANSFQHFWEDGILEEDQAAEAIAVRRKRLLVALGTLLRRGEEASRESILAEADRLGVDPVEANAELADLCRREVLREQNGTYSCRVGLFERWLREKGVTSIIVRSAEVDAILARRRVEAEAYVTSEELAEVVSQWGLYRGQRVTIEHARSWLSQFGSHTNQRIMLNLLKRIDFYGPDRIRSHLREAHKTIARYLSERLSGQHTRLHRVLVVPVGGPGKSGPTYAKHYQIENRIFHENVVNTTHLPRRVNRETEAVVFVDDFVGSGSSVVAFFSEILPQLGTEGVQLFVATVCGTAEGMDHVERSLKALGVEIRVVPGAVLGDEDRAFAEGVWKDVDDLQSARDLALSAGRGLESKWPLGYQGSELLVVFDSSVPNNSLPILWGASEHWRPLFARA